MGLSLFLKDSKVKGNAKKAKKKKLNGGVASIKKHAEKKIRKKSFKILSFIKNKHQISY